MKRQRFYKTFFVILLFFHFVSSAQTNVLGGWYLANLNYHFNPKFVLYTEVQTRSQHIADDFYYREFKGGLGYILPGKQAVLLGFGNYKTYTYPGNFKKPIATNENRIWEQFIMTNNIGRVVLEQRYRIEQRWLNGDYANRFRYRLSSTIPLNHASITKNTLFISFFD